MSKLKYPSVAIPKNMEALPVTAKGYLKPWFVKGDDFRVMDEAKAKLSIVDHHCWICGNKMRKRFSFVGGMLSTQNRMYSEPPCHQSCAEYAMKVCPFILLPKATRRNAGLTEDQTVMPDSHVQENPEMWGITTVKKYKTSMVNGYPTMHFSKQQIISTSTWKEGIKIKS
jgi:hypothetical protein